MYARVYPITMKHIPEIPHHIEATPEREGGQQEHMGESVEVLARRAEAQAEEFQSGTQAYEQRILAEADRAGVALHADDIAELHALNAQVETAKQSLLDRLFGRIKQTFSIPKRIDAAVLEAEQSGDFAAVDAVNADIEQTPVIQRKPSKISRKVLLGTALSLVAATHEPQIEETVKKGAELAEYVRDTVRVRLPDIKAYGRLALEEMMGGSADAAEGGVKGEEGDESQGWDWKADREKREEVNSDFKKFLKTLPALSEERYREAIDVYDSHHRGWRDIDPAFFLKNEFIHGRMDVATFQEAEDRLLLQQFPAVRERLSEEERKDIRRIAFELAKQRTVYEPEKADQYSMIMDGQGNCDALTAYVLSGLRVLADGPESEVKAQKFHDHVRIIVRNNDREQWTAIEGHRLVPLTVDELRGTLLVSIEDMTKNTVLKPERALKKKFSNSVTNSFVGWDTSDARSPSRDFIDPSIKLTRLDEHEEAEKTFEEARRATEGHVQYVEITVTFEEGSVELNTIDKSSLLAQEEVKERKAEEVKEIPVRPSDKEVERALEGNYLQGAYNDLTPLKGISVEQIILRTPYPNSKNPDTRKVDLSPLQESPVATLRLFGLNPVHYKSLSFANLNEFETDAIDTAFIQKVLSEANELYTINLSFDQMKDGLARDLESFKKQSLSAEHREIMRLIEQKTWNMKEDRYTRITLKFFFDKYSVRLDYDPVEKKWEFERIENDAE